MTSFARDARRMLADPGVEQAKDTWDLVQETLVGVLTREKRHLIGSYISRETCTSSRCPASLAAVGTYPGSPGDRREQKMRKLISALGISAALAAAGIAVAGPASAMGPCGSAVVLGNGGGRCDYDEAPDGSFTRCDTVYVLGFGGTNCYRVYPPADPPRQHDRGSAKNKATLLTKSSHARKHSFRVPAKAYG
jgi:hypothetical protein